MDDFDELYQDELEALEDFDDLPYDGVLVKGKKSLDFSTPSSVRHSNKRATSSQNDESFSIRPLEESIESADGNVFPSNQAKRKRSDNDVYGGLSGDEDGCDKENTETDDIPLLKRHDRKRPKLVSEVQPIPEEFDISPHASPKVTKKSTPRQATNLLQNKSQISYPTDQMSFDSFKNTSDTATKSKLGQSEEKMSAEEKRITENYDFERKRVLKRIPFERDFISVSNAIGRKFYMELRDEELEMENEAQEWSHSSLGFLGVPISVLRAQIEEDKRAKELQVQQALGSRFGTEPGHYPENIEELPEICEMDDDLKKHSEFDSFADSNGLWVDIYSPNRYTELLSDESTNRLLLKWLKLWDYVVFGREKKPPSQHAMEKAKKKEQTQQKFFNKFAPEVIEELDNHQRPMQKVALLCGPPGLGKTTLGHVIAKHAGYNVVEMNASDDRSVEVFKQKVESAIQMKSVLEADPRPNCLIVDEIDGAPTPAINTLLNIIKASDSATDGKKKKVPTATLR